MFVASFDGTGNDAFNDPEHATNVAHTHHAIRARNAEGDYSIVSGYVAGPGTQGSWSARIWDGARGHTYDQRLEEMYAQFIEQAAKWKEENPDAVITVASTGFSRGAEQAAGFTRLVHERGIQDPDGAVYQRDRNNQIIGVTYTQPPLQAPGSIAQAVALYDPVGTGVPVNDKDRRLPPSVISGFQIISEDERRGTFKATHIIDPGMTADGRLLAVTVPGAHSDVGGSYHRDGLGARSANLMTDYLNGLSNQPFLEKREESLDPRMNVIHRSEEGMLIYRIGNKVDRLEPEGHVERLVPKHMVDKVADPNNAEPRDEALNARFARQQVTIGPVPGQVAATATPERPLTPDMPGHPDHALHQQIRQKVEQMDAGLGRSYDAMSERMTASLLTVAKANGMERVDQVMLSRDSAAGPAGQHVFLVQGNAEDPLRMRLQVNTGEALSVPVENSWQALEKVNAQQEAQRQANQEQLQTQQQTAQRM
ncbi:MAG: XVIPCD domain-containing protein [Stenotrophomonas sp.]